MKAEVFSGLVRVHGDNMGRGRWVTVPFPHEPFFRLGPDFRLGEEVEIQVSVTVLKKEKEEPL